MNILRRSVLAWCTTLAVLVSGAHATEHDHYYAVDKRIELETLSDYRSFVAPDLTPAVVAQTAAQYPAIEVVGIPLATERYGVHLVRRRTNTPDASFVAAIQALGSELGIDEYDPVFRAKETIVLLTGDFTVKFARRYENALDGSHPAQHLGEILELESGSVVEKDKMRPEKSLRYKVRFGGISAAEGIPRINRINGRPEIWGAWPDFIRLLDPPAGTTRAEAPRTTAPGGPRFLARESAAPGACSGSPNDPLFGDQWALENTPEPPPSDCPSNNVDDGFCDSDIDWSPAWQAAQSAAALEQPVIAILDGGIQRHEDLDLQIPGKDAIGQGIWEPLYWFRNHGTRVAGVAGAIVNNCTGTTGAAVSAKTLSVRIFNHDSPDPLLPDIAGHGILLAALADARVLNNSWGHAADDADVISALETFIENVGKVIERDALFVVAAGNIPSETCYDDAAAGGKLCSPTGVKFPATLAAYPDRCLRDRVVAVSATNQKDEFKTVRLYKGTPYDPSTAGSEFWGSRHGPEVSLAAPAEELPTTDTDDSDTVSDEYSWISETSAAAPVVSGAATTLFAFHPTATAVQVKRWMLNTTDPGHDQPVSSVSGRPIEDDYFGHGRLNLNAALIRANAEMTMAASYQPQAGIDVAVERRNRRIKFGKSRHVVARIMQDDGQGQLAPVINQEVTFSVGGWFGRSPLDLLTPEEATTTTDCDGIAIATIRGRGWLLWGGKITATAGNDSDAERVTVPELSTWTLLILTAFVVAVIIRSGAHRDA